MSGKCRGSVNTISGVGKKQRTHTNTSLTKNFVSENHKKQFASKFYLKIVKCLLSMPNAYFLLKEGSSETTPIATISKAQTLAVVPTLAVVSAAGKILCSVVIF